MNRAGSAFKHGTDNKQLNTQKNTLCGLQMPQKPLHLEAT